MLACNFEDRSVWTSERVRSFVQINERCADIMDLDRSVIGQKMRAVYEETFSQ